MWQCFEAFEAKGFMWVRLLVCKVPWFKVWSAWTHLPKQQLNIWKAQISHRWNRIWGLAEHVVRDSKTLERESYTSTHAGPMAAGTYWNLLEIYWSGFKVKTFSIIFPHWQMLWTTWSRGFFLMNFCCYLGGLCGVGYRLLELSKHKIWNLQDHPP